MPNRSRSSASAIIVDQKKSIRWPSCPIFMVLSVFTTRHAAHEAVNASLELRVVDAAVIDIAERDAELVQYTAGGQHATQ